MSCNLLHRLQHPHTTLETKWEWLARKKVSTSVPASQRSNSSVPVASDVQRAREDHLLLPDHRMHQLHLRTCPSTNTRANCGFSTDNIILEQGRIHGIAQTLCNVQNPTSESWLQREEGAGKRGFENAAEKGGNLAKKSSWQTTHKVFYSFAWWARDCRQETQVTTRLRKKSKRELNMCQKR